MRSSFGRFGMLKAKILGTTFCVELSGRREIGLPPAVTKTNELIAKHLHTKGFVFVYSCIT